MSFRFDVAADTDVNLDHRASAPTTAFDDDTSLAGVGRQRRACAGQTAARAWRIPAAATPRCVRPNLHQLEVAGGGKRGNPLRHGLVIERIGEPIVCRRSADIGSQLQIQQQLPAGLAFQG